MTRSFRPTALRKGATILLVADSPQRLGRPGLDTPVARREAIISLARATFAVGAAVAVPLDVDVAPLLGRLALDYVAPRVAESRGEPAPVPLVTVMETSFTSEPARRLLAPLAARGAISLIDPEGQGVRLETSAEPEPEIAGLSDIARQPITPRMVELVHPDFAVLINPGRRMIEEVSVLRGAQVPSFRFGAEDVEDRFTPSFLEVNDPTVRLLEGTTRSPWAEEDDVPPGAHLSIPPYAYLMQRLVAERLDL